MATRPGESYIGEMSESSAPRKETPQREEAQDTGGGFRADLPLAILESVRNHDRPTEVLEDEDLSASLPRRLGLTGVVESQIHRYKVARKRRERVSREEVSDLLRLVMRRPDCEPILREAGHALAQHHGRKPLYGMASAARVLPDRLTTRFAQRNVSRLLKRIGGGSNVRVTGNPLRIQIDDAVTAKADRYGIACVLYGAAIEEAVQHAVGRRPTVDHVECESRIGDRCVWEVTW
jgi:predicted hydrocarbon binding protein